MSEHAVIVHFEYGSTDLELLYELEDQLIAAVEKADAGEFDGNEMAIDGSGGTFYMYGPDADKLFDAVSPVLKATSCIRKIRIAKRYGPPQSGVKETVIEL
jgi:hypothetical protein